MRIFKILIFFFLILFIGNNSTKAIQVTNSSIISKKAGINIESLSKRYFEYEDIDKKLLHGVEYTVTFSLPIRDINEQTNYYMELVLPKKTADIFGTNIVEINQNIGYVTKNGRAYFSIPSPIATSEITKNQKKYLQNNNDVYTIKIFSKNKKLIKQDVIEAKKI